MTTDTAPERYRLTPDGRLAEPTEQMRQRAEQRRLKADVAGDMSAPGGDDLAHLVLEAAGEHAHLVRVVRTLNRVDIDYAELPPAAMQRVVDALDGSGVQVIEQEGAPVTTKKPKRAPLAVQDQNRKARRSANKRERLRRKRGRR